MISIREAERRLRQKHNQRPVDQEVPLSMHLSHIMDKQSLRHAQRSKLERLERKLSKLDDAPFELVKNDLREIQKTLRNEILNNSDFVQLSKRADSNKCDFMVLDQEKLEKVEKIMNQNLKEILYKKNLNQRNKNNGNSESKAQSRSKSGSKNDNISETPENRYLKSNVPKIDRNPKKTGVCFLKPETQFAPSFDPHLPVKLEKTVFDSFGLTVYVDRERTGFEDSKDFPIVIGSLIAGRYRVKEFLGAASFAKCIHVKDLKADRHCCLKIIENNKDFIDQSIDEIKLLRFAVIFLGINV